MELSKADKHKAREIIENGLQKELENGLKEFSKILDNRSKGNMPKKEAYHSHYISLTSFDKHIADRYNRLTG